MKIRYEIEKPKDETTCIRTVPLGTVFLGSIEGRVDVYLAIYGRIVSLGAPHHVWSKEASGGTVITNYRPVAATLIVHAEPPEGDDGE